MSKKSIFLLLISCFICSGSFMVVGSWLDIFSRKYYEIVPFETFSTNAMILPVTIGKKTYHFQFDTGASTSVSKELSEELNLAIIDSAVSRDYYGNNKKVYQAILPGLTIGKTLFRNIRVGIIRPIQSFLPFGMKIDGCLGNDVLSKGVVQIDMRNLQLVIANSMKTIDVAKHRSVDFQVNDQMIPYLVIHFPGIGVSEKVMFDTGSANYYYRLEKNSFHRMIQNKELQRKDILDTLGLSANGSGAFGKQKEKEIYLVNFDSISFVGQTIYNCPAYTFTSGYSSVVGSPFLQLGVVTINYRDQKFYFKPYHDQLIDLRTIPGRARPQDGRQLLADKTDNINPHAQKKHRRKDYTFKDLNFYTTDSLSSTELLKFGWPEELKGAKGGLLMLTIDKEKQGLENAIEEIDSGKGMAHEKVMENIRNK